MRIGIDFDNTIACYSHLFARVGFDLGFISNADVCPKEKVKTQLFAEGEVGHYKWRCIQGQIYGKYMPAAKVMPGFMRFLARCAELQGVELFIVSHKTKFGHYDEDKVNLRKAASHWLQLNEIAGKENHHISTDNIYFESTRAEKIERIKSLQCSHFVDDLLVVLTDEEFPQTIKKYLFLQDKQIMNEAGEFAGCGDWYRISETLLGGA